MTGPSPGDLWDRCSIGCVASRRHTGVRARHLPPAVAYRTQLSIFKSDLLARPIHQHNATRLKPTRPRF